MLRKIWSQISIAISIPVLAGLVVLALFGQICLDKLPYLLCD